MADLEGLKDRIREWAGRAVREPMEAEVYNAWVAFGFELPQTHRVFKRQLDVATTQVRFAELDALLPTELEQLFAATSMSILEALDECRLPVSTPLRQFLDAKGPCHFFEHEWEHGGPLPEEVRRDACIDLLIARRTRGDRCVLGVCEYQTNSYGVVALAASDPRSLSESDVETAQHAAAWSGVPELSEIVEQRIRCRFRHYENGLIYVDPFRDFKGDWNR